MTDKVRRIFVEKKPGFDIEASMMLRDLRKFIGIDTIDGLRIVHRYDIEGISDSEYLQSRATIFAEPPVDVIYDENLAIPADTHVIAIEYLPGQYDQRADSAAQCVQILAQRERPEIRCAKLILIKGALSEEQLERIKNYCLNPLESRMASLEKPTTLEIHAESPDEVEIIHGFTTKSHEELESFRSELGLAMSTEDLMVTQEYFRLQEKREPSLTEIRVLDTYWSDHCRHTTFLTEIKDVQFEPGDYAGLLQNVYQQYLHSRETVYKERKKSLCLMDLATIAMKELKKKGLLNDLDESEEINACSIKVNVEIDGKIEPWLVMFKNETHNHPTEIEPFGGAATCLGGAIRDPLSGRSYVYQAMRVTGSGDPRTSIAETIPGKLPQRKITTGAAAGFSSYGNQIGLATGQVAEIYDDGYIAKRLEIGAVVGAAPAENVIRERPIPGDVIILLGGRTGRDGCGGATGSSKEHNEDSLATCGAEVQKGNPPTERKLQRLFRNAEVSKMIKRCNDFGAGGVSVAIGELADSLDINLDAVPKKYDGLDGTELAISESQERMAVAIARENVERFIKAAEEENLEATPVAVVTASGRLRMQWRGKFIVDIKREFLNTNGAKQHTEIKVLSPSADNCYLRKLPQEVENFGHDLKKAWLANLERLNVSSQKGLVERFDSSIGAGSVLMPFGGKTQMTPVDGMVAKLPVQYGETPMGTAMTFGYNPSLSKWSPFHGAFYAIVDAMAKMVALGGDHRGIRLTLQEYFEKLGTDSVKWGKPFSALLGAYYAQTQFGIPAIGGKDSMSGTFKDMNVPPTLVAFALTLVDVNDIISPEFKRGGNPIIMVLTKHHEDELPDIESLQKSYDHVHQLIKGGKVLSAHAIGDGGVAAVLSKMAFGNEIGFELDDGVEIHDMFAPLFGNLILEIDSKENLSEILAGLNYRILGKTILEPEMRIKNVTIPIEEALSSWTATLERVFPTKVEYPTEHPTISMVNKNNVTKPRIKVAHPKVFIPVFPGTNCEYDTLRRFEKAGAKVETFVFRNLTPNAVEFSIQKMTEAINQAQIIMIPGGFSAGDEPEGSGKFIATVFRNPQIKEAVMKLLKDRDGLMLGICNGFQALIKLGLVPYGEIRDITENSPTLTFNTIGRHVSCMVQTKIISTNSPWLSKVKAGDLHMIPVSHGEGRFVAPPDVLDEIVQRGQVVTQYVDFSGTPTYDIRFNPNGSMLAIEGIMSPDGRVWERWAIRNG
jgi:phosphoribosylformylglycinamidine synthase